MSWRPTIAAVLSLPCLLAARPALADDLPAAPAPAVSPVPVLPARVLGADVPARLLALLTPPAEGIPEAPGAGMVGITVAQSSATVRYGLPDGPVTIRLLDPALPCPGCPASAAFGVSAPPEPAAQALAAWVAGRLDGPAGDWWSEIRMDGSPGRSREASIDLSVSVGDPGRPFSAWFHLAGASWVVLFASLLLALALRVRQSGLASLSDGALLFAGSLAIRLLGATWGPGDMHFYFAVFYGLEEPVFGPGPDPLMMPLVRWLHGTENLFVTVNLVAGSLAPALLLALLERDRLGTRSARVCAAIVLMVLPLAIRHSGDAHRHALVMTLGIASLWGLAMVDDGRRILGSFLAISATLLCFLTRPEGSLLFLLQGAFVAGRMGLPTRRWAWPALPVAISAAVFLPYMALVHTAPRGIATTHVAAYFSRLDFASLVSWWNQAWLDPRWTPAFVIAALVLGLYQAVRTRAPRPAWAWASLLMISWFFAAMPTSMSGWMQLANARYQALSFPMVAILAGAGVALVGERVATLRGVPRALVVVVLSAACLASLAVPYRLVLPPAEVDSEYLAIRSWIPDLPPDSEIHYTYGRGGHRRVEDMALPDPFWLSRILDRPDVTWREWPFEAPRPGRPRFFLRQSACAEADRMRDRSEDFRILADDCRKALAEASPVPFRHAVLPYRILMDLSPHPGTIEIGLYRLPDDPIPLPAPPSSR